jgi:hypothetical protein
MGEIIFFKRRKRGNKTSIAPSLLSPPPTTPHTPVSICWFAGLLRSPALQLGLRRALLADEALLPAGSGEGCVGVCAASAEEGGARGWGGPTCGCWGRRGCPPPARL